MSDPNPKNAFGLAKPPLHLIPANAQVQVSMVMALGAAKYGAYNWRDSAVTASTYVGAAQRHLASWFDGEGTDPESHMSHIAHMVACGLILLDAMACGKFIDDRPTPAPTGELIAALTKKVKPCAPVSGPLTLPAMAEQSSQDTSEQIRASWPWRGHSSPGTIR